MQKIHPIVAIIGRPNVGKSTLFNKIIGKRKAIVDSTPGITRDRNYEDLTYRKRNFTIVDTGGFDPDAKSSILSLMKDQVNVALEEADVILFVSDGKEGLTSLDISISDFLRTSQKKVFYVINKIDQPFHLPRISDFYIFGVEKLYPVSAENGYGVYDLLDDIVEVLPPSEKQEREDIDIPKISVIGRPNVGKSTLINQLLGEERLLVDNKPGTTRDYIDTVIKSDEGNFIFIDTAGIRRKSKIGDKIERYGVIRALKTVEMADIVLVLIDAWEGVTNQDINLINLTLDRGKGLIICVNKWDKVSENVNLKEYKKLFKKTLHFVSFAPFLFISALKNKGVGEIIPTVNKVFESYRKRISTSVLNRTILSLTEKKHPPSKGRKIFKTFFISQVANSPPTIVLFVNHPELVTEPYKRYLLNHLREAFKFTGVPLRLIFRKKS